MSEENPNSQTPDTLDIESNFGAAILASSTPTEEPAKETEKEAPDAEETETEKPAKKEPVKDATKEVAKKETKKAAKEEPKAAKEEAKEESASDDDLPVNPHFQDKPVAEKPEGDNSEKGLSSWKEHKQQLKAAREERDRLAAELTAAKELASKVSTEEVGSIKQELEDAKTRLAELNRELKAANVERSPEYVEAVKKPLAGIQSDLQAIAKKNDSDYSKLWAAITEPDVSKRADALEELTADFKRTEQFEVINYAKKYHELAGLHERYQKEAETLTEAQKARKAQEEQEFIENDQRLQKAFTAQTWTRMEDKYPFLKELEGQDEWNKSIHTARRTAAETNLDRLSVEDRSAILTRAAVVPFLESAINHYTQTVEKVSAEKDAKIKELEGQLAALAKATPSFGSDKETDPTEEDVSTDERGIPNLGKLILGG
jgi:hypothetical protein